MFSYRSVLLRMCLLTSYVPGPSYRGCLQEKVLEVGGEVEKFWRKEQKLCQELGGLGWTLVIHSCREGSEAKGLSQDSGQPGAQRRRSGVRSAGR